jgi:hypothetical protein
VANNNTLTATQIPTFAKGYTWCGFDPTNEAGQVVTKIADAVSHA